MCSGAFLERSAPCCLGRHLLTQKHVISQSLATWRCFIWPQHRCAATAQILGREASSQTRWMEHRVNSFLYVLGRREQFLSGFFSPLNCFLSVNSTKEFMRPSSLLPHRGTQDLKYMVHVVHIRHIAWNICFSDCKALVPGTGFVHTIPVFSK